MSDKQTRPELDASDSVSALAATIASTEPFSTAPTLIIGLGNSQLEAEARSVTAEAPGRYELRGEIGKGGQARVLLAWDHHIGREVAWKELLRDDDEEASVGGGAGARFLREARIAGRLEHPSIVPVHEVGRRSDGTFYYTMRRVAGGTLEKKLKECASADDRMKLLGAFWDVCNAIAYAHANGVIHRDLKPANIMVGEFGETVVLDWGLAKVRGTDDVRRRELANRTRDWSAVRSSETVAGFALGTPAYMSPEQARGDLDDIDERSDVWGLGAVLYEILTGRAPFEGPTVIEVLRRVIHERLIPVAELEPTAPPDLAAIAAKALRKDRAARYENAKAVADDIGAFMTGRRVLAYEYSAWELLRRFARRYRAAVVAAAAVLLVVLGALVVLSFAWRDEKASRRSERDARLHADQHLAQALSTQAVRLLEQNRTLSARILATASLVHNPANPWGATYDPDYATRERDADWLRVDAASVLVHTDHRLVQGLSRVMHSEDAITHCTYTADGRHLISGDYSGTIFVWDAADGRLVQRLKASTDKIHVIATSGDPRVFASAGGDRIVRVWRLGNAEPVKTSAPFGASLHALAWSPDGKRIAIGESGGKLEILDAESLAVHQELEPHGDRVRGLEYSRDGKWLASSSWDKTARIWEAETGKIRHRLTGHDGSLYELAFSPDSRRLVTASWDRKARVWDVETGERKLLLEGSLDALYDVAWSGDGRWIATSGLDHSWRLWDAVSGRMMLTVEGSSEAVTSVAFSPDGRSVVTASQDRMAKLWQLSANDGLLHIEHGDWVGGMAFSPDGKLVASGGADRKIKLWDAVTGAPAGEMIGHTDIVYAVEFSPDGSLIASGSNDDTVRVWSVAERRQLRELKGHQADVQALRFTPDGSSILSSSYDSTARLWDARTGEQRSVLGPHSDWARGIAISADGRIAAVGCHDRNVWLWELQTGKLSKKLAGHEDWVSDVALTHDGTRLVSVGKDRRVYLWDVASGQRVGEFVGHRQWVNTVDLSRDERWLATGSDDRLAVIWDMSTMRSVLHLRAATAVQQVKFSPDGRRIAVADNESITVFPLETKAGTSDAQQELKSAQQQAGLELRGFELEDVHHR